MKKRNIHFGWRRVGLWLGALLFLLFLPYLTSRALSPWRRISIHSGNFQAAATNVTRPLRIVTYNIAHGRGNGLSTRNWTGESKSGRRQRLNEIAGLLRELDADIVVLNEVDFESSWSHGINQARHLATTAGYNYWAEQRNLDFRFLTKTWRFGNAVLSRYPIQEARVINLPGYSWWETLLAGKKRGVLCEIELPDRRIRVAGVHLSHRSEGLRVRSARMIRAIAGDSSVPLVVAGDLNSSPAGFPHATSDAEGNNAINVFDASNQFERKPLAAPDQEGMTFHSTKPTCVIDWILIPLGWEFLDYAVPESDLSDHRPVFVRMRPGAVEPPSQ